MTIPAQKFREVVFQLLYSYDIGKASDESMIDLLSKELAVSKTVVRDANSRVQEILKHREEIDTIIAETSYAYAFERIQSVERNILRIGVYELLHDKDVAPKIAIAEAMRLSRKFSTKESATFINAILDAVYKKSVGKPADPKELAKSAEELEKIEKVSQEASKMKNTHKKNDD